MQEKHQEEKLKYAQQLAQHHKSLTESIQPEKQKIPLSENPLMIKSKIQISSHKFYGLTIGKQVSKIAQNSIDPFSKYFQIYFQTVIYGEQQLQQIKKNLEKDINSYVESLYINFMAYSYFTFLERRKKNQPLPISFKQFASLNISLNIFSMMEAIQTKLIATRPQQEQEYLKNWLLTIVEESLTTNISDIIEHYPQGKMKDCHQQNAQKMKKYLLKIDRRQNEQYDFFIINSIQYNGAEKLILETINQISKISSNNYGLKDSIDKQSLQNEIIKMNSLIFEQAHQIKEKQELNMKIKQRMHEKLTQTEELHYKKEPLRKIRSPIIMNCQNKQAFINTMLKNMRNSSSYLRILMKFIQNLLQLLEDPSDLTKLRKLPYKNLKNQLIQPNNILNNNLYENLIRINSQIIENQGRNINMITNKRIKLLMETKQNLFKQQKEIIFSNFGKKLHLLKRQLQISSQIYKNILQATFNFLHALIQLIIEAGKVINQDGEEININLVTFNLGDLFRAKKSVSLENFKNILNAIHILQDPLPFDCLPAQNIFRIVRYKDKTDTLAQGILFNYIYKNSVQCQLQINTKTQDYYQLNQVNHMLYELKRGQFGILSQIMILVATSYLKESHQVSLFKQNNPDRQSSISSKAKLIQRQIFSESKKLLEREEIKGERFRNWTYIFIKQTKKSEQKKKQNMNFQKKLQKKNNFNRLQSLINQDEKLLLKIIDSNQSRFVKNLVIKKKELRESFKIITLDDLNKFPCVERLVLNGFHSEDPVFNSIQNIDFISIYSLNSMKEIDLSENNIESFDSFLNYLIIYENLQILNLSKNQFKGTHQFAIGWFPKLKNFNLTGNKFKSFIITHSFACSKQKISNQSEFKILQQQAVIQRQILKTSWISFFSKTKIKLKDQYNILTILIDYLKQIKQKKQSFCLLKQQQQYQSINRQLIHQNNQIQKIQGKKQFRFYKSTIVRENQQNRYQNHQADAMIRVKTNKNYLTQSYGQNLMEQDSKQNNQYLMKAAKYFESKSGLILRRQDNNLAIQLTNGTKINHNIVLAPAHSIMSRQQSLKWLDSIQQRKLRETIMKRTYFRDKQSGLIISLKDFWIPLPYIYNNRSDKYIDMCLLTLNIPQQKGVVEEKREEELKIHVVYNQIKNPNSITCTLSAYVFGYLEDQQNYCYNIVDATINNSNDPIQIKNKIFKNGASGSLLANIQLTDKNKEQYNILGFYKSFQTDSYGAVQKIDSQLKRVYHDMNRSGIKKVVNIVKFRNYQQFMQRKQKYLSINSILKKEGKQLIFLRKFLKMFVKILESYLFITQQSLDINKEFFLKMHFYNFEGKDLGDCYEADLRGIRFKTVFSIIGGKLQYVQYFKSLFCVDLIYLQNRTLKALITILKKIKSLLQNNQVEVMTQYFIKFIQSKSSISSIKKPIALLKILQVIVWAIDYKDQNKIIQYLQQQGQDSFYHPSYFSIVNILINLNSCRRINYYSQIIRSSKDAPDFVNIHTNIRNRNSTESLNISYQNNLRTELTFIQQCQGQYSRSLKTVIKFLQKRNIPPLQNPKDQQLIENQIKKIFMLQALKDFYQQQQINMLIKQFHNVAKAQQFENLILQILTKRLKNLFNNKSDYYYMMKQKQLLQDLFVGNLKIEFQALCYFFKSLFIDSRQSRYLLNINKDYKQYISQSPIKNASFSHDFKRQEYQFGETYNIKKKISSQGHFEASSTQYSKFTTIQRDKNKNIYENHIGLIYIFDDDNLNVSFSQDTKFAFGTGVLIGKRTVSTAAHVLTPYILGNFPIGKIKFVLPKAQRKQNSYEWANIIEVRLTKSKDIALLILDNDLVKQPKIRLVTHNKDSKESNFKGRSYFCQIVAYHIKMGTKQKWKLLKSQGYIHIDDMDLTDFRYTLSTAKGTSGGAILFFPTGDYNQPYMLGIHTEGSVETSNYLGINKNLYINQIFNRGRKCQKNLFDKDNKSITVYAANGFQINQQKLQFSCIHQNSYIFNSKMYEIYKWQLIYKLHKKNFGQQQDKIYGLPYNRLLQYMWNHFQIEEMTPQNLFCYYQKIGQPFFSLKINDYKQQFSREFLKQKVSNKQKIQAKKMFQKTINMYDKHISAAKMIQKHLQFIKNLNEIDYKELFNKFVQFKQYINLQLIRLKNCKLFKLKCLDILEKQILFSLNISLNIKNLEQLALSILPHLDQVRQLNQFKTKLLNFKNYSNLQQQFFNKEYSFINYLNNFRGKSQEEEDQLFKLGIRYKIVKTACSITQSLHSLYIKLNLTKSLDEQKDIIFSKTPVLQLDQYAYQFTPRQTNNRVPSCFKNFFVYDIKHRAQALFLIEKISYLQPQWRQVLVQKIMNFNKAKQYWKKTLYKKIEENTTSLLRREQNYLQKIISQIYNNYHYSVEGHYHSANIGRCCLQELYLLKQIISQYSLTKDNIVQIARSLM